jgi:hypothetical protein
MTRLSCHRFRSSKPQLCLSVIGIQLGEPMAAAGAAQADQQLVANSLQQRLVKTGGRLGQARTVLLAADGGKPPNAAAVRSDCAEDCR